MRTLIIFCCFFTLHAAAQQRYPELIPYYSNGIWGYCDSNKHICIPAQWDGAEFFRANRALVSYNRYTDSNKHLYSMCIINSTGSYIIPPSRHWNSYYPMNRELHAYDIENRDLFYSSSGWSGQKAKPYLKRPDVAYNASDTVVEKWGIIDTNNSIVVPFLYDGLSAGLWLKDKKTGAQYFLGGRNRKFGIIDAQQQTVLKFEYDALELADTTSNYFLYRKEKKYGVVALDGTSILPPVFDELNYYPQRIWVGKKDDKYGVYDSAGKELTPHKYQWIHVYPDSLEVILNGKRALADMQGKVRTAFRTGAWRQPVDFMSNRPYCGGVRVTPPKAVNLILHNGKRTQFFNINGRRWHSIRNISLSSVDATPDLLYMASAGTPGMSDWPPEVMLVDTNFTQRSVIFNTWLNRIIGNYIECSMGNGMALFDTAGTRVTDTISREIKGYITNAKGEMLLITRTGYPTYQLESTPYQEENNYEQRHKLLKGDTVVTATGKPLPQFYKYTAIWYIPLAARKLIGREDVVFASDKNGYVGVVDADGKVVFPAISFKYKGMDIVYGNNLCSDNVLAAEQRLPTLQGCFMVTDDSSRKSYFNKDAVAPLPALNFQYINEPVQISDGVFYIPEKTPDVYWYDYKVVNSRNKNLLPGIHIMNIKKHAHYQGLYEVTIPGEKYNTLTVYMSDKGILYADAIK